jgi:hypothetical protein
MTASTRSSKPAARKAAAKAATRPVPTFDHLKSAKKAIVVRDWFGVPEEMLQAYQIAKRMWDAAVFSDDEDRMAKAKEALEKARQLVIDNGVEVVMRSCGRSVWEDLKEKHPPLPEQIAEVRKQNSEAVLDYNWKTFPVPAIAASVIQPEMTEEQVQELWDSEEWNEAECARLFQMALQANTRHHTADLGF